MDELRLGFSISTFHKLKLWERFGFGLEWSFGWKLSYGVEPGSGVESVMAGRSLAMRTGKSSGTLF